MYLSAKKYFSGGEWRPEENRKEFHELLKKSGIAKHVKTDFPSVQLEVSIGYWRKANAVHQWFVDNCQNGEDDCRETWVGRERLEQLREVCMQVLADHSKADELLPTASGFFFGSTEYDEWYFSDVKETVDIIDNALAMPDEWDFYYHSSW